MSASHLSHVPTAFFCALCMWSVVRLLRTRRRLFGLTAGLGMGMAFLCRPLTALAVGGVIGLGPLWYWRRALRRWPAVGAALLLAVLGIGLLMAYQHQATGDYLTAGHKVGLGRRAKYGFGEIDFARTHTVVLGLEHTRQRMQAMNRDVLGWPVPALLVALLPFLLGHTRKEDVWLLLPALVLLLAYMAFWYFEHYYPGRYIFAGVPMLIVLAARGCRQAATSLRGGEAGARRAVPAVVTACLLFNLAVFLPHRVAGFGGTFADVETVLPRVLAAHDFSGALVFVDAVERSHDLLDPFNDFYGTAFMRNDLDFDGDTVFVRNLRERNHEMVALHPDRDYFLYRYHRGLDKALVFRLRFDGEQQRAEPMAMESDYVMPPEGGD
jgi:4-amino-4-deoxy-L-arabinose transferase-like glycosyltransferase